MAFNPASKVLKIWLVWYTIYSPMSETKDRSSRRNQYLLSALVKAEKDFDDLLAFIKGYELVLVKTENLGEQVLTFAINKNRALMLVSAFFTCEADVIPRLEKDLRHEEYVERFLLTTWKADPDAPKRQTNMRGGRRDRDAAPSDRPMVASTYVRPENV